MSETIETVAPAGDVNDAQAGGHLVLTIVAVFFSLLAIAVVVIINRLGPFIKYIVEKYGSKYIQTRITVKSIDISLLRGSVEVRGIEVANPAGFSDSNIAQLDSISVKFSPKVWKKPFTVHAVIVQGTQVTYEVNFSGTNVGALLAAMSSPPKEDKKEAAAAAATKEEQQQQQSTSVEDETPITSQGEEEKDKKDENSQNSGEKVNPEEEKKEEKEEEKEEAQPSFLIELVDITGTRVNFGVGSIAKVPIPIVPIQMKNVGASSVSSLVYDIVARICEAVVSATASTAEAAASAAYSVAADAVSSLWGWATGSSSSSSSSSSDAPAAPAPAPAPVAQSNDGETLIGQGDDEVPIGCNGDDEVPMSCNDEVPMSCNDEVPMSCNDEVPMGCDDEVPMGCNGEVPIGF